MATTTGTTTNENRINLAPRAQRAPLERDGARIVQQWQKKEGKRREERAKDLVEEGARVFLCCWLRPVASLFPSTHRSDSPRSRLPLMLFERSVIARTPSAPRKGGSILIPKGRTPAKPDKPRSFT